MRGTIFCGLLRNGLRRYIGVAVLAALAAVVWVSCGGGDTGVNQKPVVKQFAVAFNTNGGIPATIPPVVVDSGAALGAKCPADPTKAGNVFAGWFDEEAEYTASTIITEDVTLTARWDAAYRLTTGVTPVGAGTVSRGPELEDYADGTEVTVTAAAADGYRFTGWSGASVSADGTITVTMDDDITLTANFEEIVIGSDTYTLTVSATPAGSGTALRNPSKTGYGAGDRVSITAEPMNGYKFVSWTITGDSSTIDSPVSGSTSVTVNANTTVVANFQALPTYTLTVNVTPTSGGTVARRPSSTNSSYLEGTQVTLTAGAADGYRFSNWTGGVTGTDTVVTITMNADMTLTANFELTYTLTINQAVGGTVTRNPDQENYVAGMAVNVTATPEGEGYRFKEWAGASTSTDSEITVTMDRNLTLTPSFIKQYVLVINVIPAGSGTVSRDPNLTQYDEGAKVKLTANAAEGYVFKGDWLVEGAVIDANTIEITMASDITTDVNFMMGFIDARDGKAYRTVRIGDFMWMAENLNFETGRGSWCYDDDDSNCAVYGRLYDWAAVMNLPDSCNSVRVFCASQVNDKHQGICPTGWYVPSRLDWNDLVSTVGSPAGTKLKAETGWNRDGNGTGGFGFSALPGGRRWDDGVFLNVGTHGYWWSATENGSGYARYRLMDYDDDYAYENYYYKSYGFSARCVRD